MDTKALCAQMISTKNVICPASPIVSVFWSKSFGHIGPSYPYKAASSFLRK